MWSSIKSILKPESLRDAWGCVDSPDTVLFAGGTYLVARKNPLTHHLIDINHLINNSISTDTNHAVFGAKTSLQMVVDKWKQDNFLELPQCARWSCPSKNIRNQRTLGGEIAHGRIDSELLACLFALNARLIVFTSTVKTVDIRNWKDDGLITAVEINYSNIDKIVIQRYALIPSAPGFVIVIGVRRGAKIDIVVAGKANRMSILNVTKDELTDAKIADFSVTAVRQFRNDHYGSLTYKQILIRTGLKHVREEL